MTIIKPDQPIPDLDIDREKLLNVILEDFAEHYRTKEGVELSDELADAYRKLFTSTLENPVLERELWNMWKAKGVV